MMMGGRKGGGREPATATQCTLAELAVTPNNTYIRTTSTEYRRQGKVPFIKYGSPLMCRLRSWQGDWQILYLVLP